MCLSGGDCCFFQQSGHGGDKIKRKTTYATIFALCVMFSTLPFAGAADTQNTNVTQSTNQNTVGTNAVTDNGLKIGANGDQVVTLQKWLKNQGYYTGNIDGSFGSYTKLAVKYFQTDSNITVDGWVANETVGAMTQLTGTNPFSVTSGTSSSSTASSTASSTDSTSSTASFSDSTSSDSDSSTDSSSDSTHELRSGSASASTTTTTSTSSTKTSTKTETTTSTSSSSGSSLSEILASGAKYGYSHSASTASGMVSSGSGDCWAMSAYLYSKLSAAGIQSRIVQYSTAYSSRHRSVQLYGSSGWYDVPYGSYGYSTMFKATSSKPGMTVIASS
ncbi:putative peptidoglycan binding domain protein [anaerobic digester metagenome]